MEERSGSFLPELPYTNRGVIRQKEELSALIDWCQVTIKEVPSEAVIEDVLRIPLELMTVTGYEKGIAGHEVVAIFDNIKVLKPTGNAQYQGFQILMSGKGCRNYENFLQLNEETWFDFFNRVCQYHINFPRIDLAIDDRKPYLSVPDLIIRTKEGLLSSKLREIDFHDSGELKEDVFQSKGGSLYLGSSASNLRLVFYEKGYEQNKKYGVELDENWNRYELRFRQEMAVSVVQELLRYRDVAGLAMEVLNSKIRFLEKPTDSVTTRKRLYPTYQAWAELMKDIGKVKLTMQSQKKSLQKVWEWLEKYVAPSLKLFAEVGKIEQRDYIGNLIENGEMNITQKQLYGAMIENAIEYVKTIFTDDYSGHDYHHTMRVYRLAVQIAKQEKADMLIVQLAALLHDVDDEKLSLETYATKKNAIDFMESNGVDNKMIETVCKIIDEVSFAGTDSVVPSTIEGKCVQDADRMDAMGAIGIARTFAYGGSKGRMIYDPEIKPLVNMSKEEYRQNQNSTNINHFFEKLLLLKDMMNTDTAKRMAERRQVVMENYLEEFMLEWEGER